MFYLYDTICVKVAFVEAYFGQRKYHIAKDRLVDILEKALFSDGMFLRTALRFSKAKRRLAKQEGSTDNDIDLLKDAFGRLGNVFQSTKLECLEEDLIVASESSTFDNSETAGAVSGTRYTNLLHGRS